MRQEVVSTIEACLSWEEKTLLLYVEERKQNTNIVYKHYIIFLVIFSMV